MINKLFGKKQQRASIIEVLNDLANLSEQMYLEGCEEIFDEAEVCEVSRRRMSATILCHLVAGYEADMVDVQEDRIGMHPDISEEIFRVRNEIVNEHTSPDILH